MGSCDYALQMARDTSSSNAPQRRTLHFTRIDQVLADVNQLAEAEQRGTLKMLGNWTFGQSLGHLASWVDYSYDGVPLKIPFFIPWIVRPLRKQFLYKPMKPGSRIPKVPGGTLATDVVASAPALDHFRRAFERLAISPPGKPHALFGKFTHQEWIAQHLRHSELHLSFMRSDG
jgi:hypothetical protein